MSKIPFARLAAVALFGLLGACSTTGGVQVNRAVPYTPIGTTLTVQGGEPDSVWATQHALREGGWNVGPGASTTVRVHMLLTSEARGVRDPFCDPWYWGHPWGRGPSWHYWNCGPWSSGNRVSVYPVRTLTWSVEDRQGRLLWQASARENRPAGPPTQLAQRLGRAMNQWQGREPAL